jgi:SpoIVB peptidase S55
MTRGRIPAVLTIGLVAFLFAAPAGAAPAPGTAGAQDFMPIEAIRPGMQGTARTVFEGNKLEEFGVEILGVLKNAIGPQQDLILARLHGPKVEFTGVVAGMSGSPVYVEGKLVGALSYRIGQFAKEAIAGITPIADMLKLEGSRAQEDGRRAETAPDLLGRFLVATGGAGGTIAGVPTASPDRGERLLESGSAATADLRPIGTPLVCSGCDPGVLRYYASIFEASGLEPSAGGGGTAERSTPLPLDPGTAIGGALVTGDLSLTGIGTLTYVEGTRVFAFGHPLLGMGSMEIPMTQAEVLLTFPSAAASFKIANATRPVGTIVQDRLTAIMGEVGRVPDTIPVTVRVASPPAPRRDFHYEIMRHRAWSPVMVAVTTANSLARTIEFDASATLAATYRIDIEGIPPVELEDLYSGVNPGQPVHIEVANDAGGLFGLLFNNRFEELKVRSVDVAVEALPPSRIAAVTSLSASAMTVRPGEPFRVSVTLSPYRGEERQIVFEASLPEDTTPGEVEIIVGSGPAIEGLDRRVLERQLAQAAGLEDLIRLVGRSKKNHDLYLRVSRRSPSAIVRSEILPDLPLSVFTVFNSPRLSADSTLMIEAPILEVSRDVGLVAVGGRRISLKVR